MTKNMASREVQKCFAYLTALTNAVNEGKARGKSYGMYLGDQIFPWDVTNAQLEYNRAVKARELMK